MRLIRSYLLDECAAKHAEVRKQLAAWRGDVQRAKWKDSIEVINSRSNVGVLGQDRFKFDIKGSKIRIVIRVDFTREVVDVRFAGTHDEYNDIDALTI